MNTQQGLYENVTLIDVQLASVYYPILVDLAKHKHCLTYTELVDRAKHEHPDSEVVQNAIPVSTGRRLDVVRLFTDERELPDLTSLVISKSTGECGSFFTRHFDPMAAREQVFSYDWNTATTDFAGFVEVTESAVKPRKKVKKPQARERMAAYYQANKAGLPLNVSEYREAIIELIMEGFPDQQAYSLALRQTG
ncbi:hypothetical protein IFT37_09080 [Pseudomonas fluorescens]|uniref:Uncharacterized protein n=1 Tax=Pseudomonas fluorescens TaxID=294 RepID=A0AAE2PXP3_PSEFL|nr:MULTISPECIES: hypothetical protein [Pseudomonas fluorescens group]MBA1431047.1 hypothetical protein [Pseudomonas orientalis]MBD8148911.1 hypothetical protein [Pseudomonas fluorescens]MBD8176396.1 hypothetical protein [Pseudomonas fluorescens]MBD8269969.1 hypothetical protein [Pseudomonas fluorescens]MBD8745255.1 hypothetical protein [Pseudomonas fluorescens]